ncbi:MAG TPA: 30S ribosomal protein S20 [Candidatus Atribacteria bacterium]|nr:30S ribosomal protein S20 [Candidatus Atribacteria bacterium]
MPNTKTAWKNLRKSEKRRMRNQSIKSATKTEIKKFNKLIEEGMVEEARSYLPQVYKKVDMAASKGVFHKNKAARIKSRLTNKLNQAVTQESSSLTQP